MKSLAYFCILFVLNEHMRINQSLRVRYVVYAMLGTSVQYKNLHFLIRRRMATHCPLDSPQIFFYKCCVLAALTILKQYACFLFAMPEDKLETLNLNYYILYLFNHLSKTIVQQLPNFSIGIINKIVMIFLYIMTNDVYFTAYSFKSISII